MRINNNISAMNAHRLLNINNTAGSKTLEKLSSGKRINRAGDDAAGMAISEKMRAQIKGLQVASRNSLDGVSLVQTAEGAMNEVHSMLQRMRELSVQAANGSSAESDRQAIQDEINQLTSEVNRIANGTEYNTRNILKGNQGPDANAVVHRMSTGEPAQTRGNVNVKSKNPPEFDLKSEQLSVFIDGEEKVVNLTGTNESTTRNDFMELLNDALGDTAKAVLDKNGFIEITTSSIGGLSNIDIKGSTGAIKVFTTGSPIAATQTTDIGGVSGFTIDAGIENGSLGNIDIVFEKGSTPGAVFGADGKLTVTLDNTKTDYDASSIAAIITEQDYSHDTNKPSELNMSKFTIIGRGTVNAKTATVAESTKLTGGSTHKPTSAAKVTTNIGGVPGFKINAGEDNGILGNIDITFNSGDTSGAVFGADGKLTVTLDNTKTDYDASSIATIITGQDYTSDTNKPSGLDMSKFEITEGGTVDATTPSVNESAKLTGGFTETPTLAATQTTDIGGIPGFTIDAGEDNGILGNIDIIFKKGSTPGAVFGADGKLTVTLDNTKSDYNALSIAAIITEQDYSNDTNKPFGLDMSKFTITGSGTVNATTATVAETTKLIGGSTPTLKATGKAENATNTSVGSFYFDSLPEVGSTIQVGNEVIEFFDSSISPYVGSNRPIDIAGKTNAEAIVDEIVNKFSTGIEGVILKKDPKFDSGNNPVKSDNARLIIESNKPGFDGNLIYLEATPDDFTTNLQVGANTGQGFRLQMGDIRAKNLKISADNPTRNPGVKGASYIKTGATITDGISSSMVEYAVDVTTEDRASAAIKVFDNAIVRIATERSKLGATQNRLEHTIANLDNTAENLTAAMSRIEDTDMALEMSNFQKMNVLQQAGVSMLAQANQQPQSILKLLS